MRFVRVLDVPFIQETKASLVTKLISPNIEKEKKVFIVTANPEIVMAAQKDGEYLDVLQRADYIVPDGIGIVMAAKWKGQPVAERIAGYDLMHDLLAIANERKSRCYFLGAAEEVNSMAVEKVQSDYPRIVIAGRHHGFFKLDDETVVEKVVSSKPDFVFVALGFPKQEKWIDRYLERFDKGLFMGVGGSFDVLSGKVKRAPRFWITLRLEWLYRLLKQPSRWRRMFPLFKFVVLALFRKV